MKKIKKINKLICTVVLGIGMVGLLGCGVKNIKQVQSTKNEQNSSTEFTTKPSKTSEENRYDPTELHRAANKGDIEKVKAILKSNPKPDVRDSFGGTELHAAMFQDNIEIVKLLIEFGSDVDAKGTSNGYTPLHDAVWAGNLPAVKLLIQSGADQSIKNDSGQTPLEKAKEENKKEIAEYLDSIKGEVIAKIDQLKETDDVITRYFKSVANENIEGFLSLFGEESEITVVSRKLNTKEQIKNFAENEVFGGVYEIYRAEETDEGIKILLQFRPEGWSNPEPFAVYDFKIEDGIIRNANLQYATNEDKKYFRELTLEKTSLIPDAFKIYLDGVDKNDSKLLASSFTEKGSVKDVSRLIEGRAAIERWADNEVLFLEYRVGKVVYKKEGAIVYNHISFGSGSGGFFGRYDMEIQNGKIKYADLQYAQRQDFEY